MRSAGLPGDLIVAEWVDSARHADGDGWVWREAVRNKTMKMSSVGWVWYADKRNITIAPHTDRGGTQGYGVMTIPRRSITRITVIQTARDTPHGQAKD